MQPFNIPCPHCGGTSKLTEISAQPNAGVRAEFTCDNPACPSCRCELYGTIHPHAGAVTYRSKPGETTMTDC